MNRELPDVQAGFRKGRGTRDQIAYIPLIIEKAREFQKQQQQQQQQQKPTSASFTTPKPSTVWITKKLENPSRDVSTRPPYMPPEKSLCKSTSNN